MKKRYVVDTSVFLTYAAYNKTYRLTNAFQLYHLEVFINEIVISELEENLSRILQKSDQSPEDIVEQIKASTFFVYTIPLFTGSPDPKDNFLFDLALQTGSEVIVTQEKALLSFAASPVAIHDIKWFKETFPVPL